MYVIRIYETFDFIVSKQIVQLYTKPNYLHRYLSKV